MMLQIQTLTALPPGALELLSDSGYLSDSRYRVSRCESEQRTSLLLELERLERPYQKRFGGPDDWLLARYRELPEHGFCLAAYDGELLAGVTLAEPQAWNRTLWVWELAVTPGRQRRGIGRRLLDELALRARAAGLRIMVCEAQSTNVPAIRFYRRVGFSVEGIDLSYYTNRDWPDGEVAVFMKRRLE